ncbi:MAG: hypothetical protein K2O40_05060 [Lachnospiraceae bacterium]|nr:hypothetical protein [Lachnospiraceae bacterium]
MSIDQIIGEQEVRRAVIGRIETAYNIEILQSDHDNHVVFEIQNDEVQSMLQLTPCIAAMRRNPPITGAGRLPCMADIERVGMDCISAASTREAYRRKGFMRRLISGALEYQNQMRVPLCLVEMGKTAFAADFFRHFGFHYIYDRPRYELNTKRISEEMLRRAAGGESVVLDESNRTLEVVRTKDLLSLAHFVNAKLCRNYGLFVIRSAAYYECFQQELQKDGGDLFQIVKDGVRKGCFAYSGTAMPSIQEVVFEEDADRERYFCVREHKCPAVMARITNMSEMLGHIAGNGKITIAIRITDPVIAENDGLFRWYIDGDGSHMERVEQFDDGQDSSMRPEVTATIGEFTAFIFEYIQLKRNVKFDSIYLSGPIRMNDWYR